MGTILRKPLRRKVRRPKLAFCCTLSSHTCKARLVATLSVVQNKLVYLEAENSVSRRRVQELETELDACKKEVARERTRIMEHEQSMMKEREDEGRKRMARERMQQHKKKSEEDQAELASAEARYKSAVEEKKGISVDICAQYWIYADRFFQLWKL